MELKRKIGTGDISGLFPGLQNEKAEVGNVTISTVKRYKGQDRIRRGEEQAQLGTAVCILPHIKEFWKNNAINTLYSSKLI